MENKIVKICKIHGALTKDQVKIAPRKAIKKSTGEPFLQIDCIECRKTYQRVYAQKNKEKCYARTKKYRENNPESVRATRIKSYYKHREKRVATSSRINQRKHAKEYRKKYTVMIRKELKDEYIRKLLEANNNFLREEITPQLIEAKRAMIILKRLIKSKNG